MSYHVQGRSVCACKGSLLVQLIEDVTSYLIKNIYIKIYNMNECNIQDDLYDHVCTIH